MPGCRMGDASPASCPGLGAVAPLSNWSNNFRHPGTFKPALPDWCVITVYEYLCKVPSVRIK